MQKIDTHEKESENKKNIEVRLASESKEKDKGALN